MFRYATISLVNCCRSLRTTSARNHLLKSKPHINKSFYKYFLFFGFIDSTGSEGGIGAGAIFKTSRIPEISIHKKTETGSTVLSSATPEIPTQVVEQIPETNSVSANANAEPTLASLGLGSWWPSGIVQQCLEYLHCTVGMPWWGAIATGTLVIRLLLVPVAIRWLRTWASIKKTMPKLWALQLKLSQAIQTGDKYLADKYFNDLMVLLKMKKINPLKVISLAFFPISISLSIFMGLWGMANLPVESMKTGGMLWFTDLTKADPYYILPLITCITLFIPLKINGKTHVRITDRKIKFLRRAIPVILFPVLMSLPAANLYYWSTANVISLILSLIFRVRVSSVMRRLSIQISVERKNKFSLSTKKFKYSETKKVIVKQWPKPPPSPKPAVTFPPKKQRPSQQLSKQSRNRSKKS